MVSQLTVGGGGVARSGRVYFRQLLGGRDFATGDPMAAQMANFCYLLGDRATGEAVVVDPAYRVAELVELAGRDGMRIVGALATHHHPDHVGGSMMGHTIEGVGALLELVSVPVHAQRAEVDSVRRMTGASAADVVGHDAGDDIAVGGLTVKVVHTPGHTPGSSCFLFEEMLVSGDTLFLEGCGRTDLPGSDPDAMYDSLCLLASLPDELAVFPGHRYSPPAAAVLGALKESNPVLRVGDRQAWGRMFGR
ncbi:MAG TPA: MBL fold metallo-hydrolase [Acidimicrobiales bacterium]|nr:MBL fold metallo-hydrolase [Acidimicrobiales bacterium]